ncbi:serine hydrolase domain-containing protein [Aquimarina algicola]|uniref:Beta-lactamase family protein n=1 Tax=Aquimarina algicola TaxID=2589995 RepID=A0A504J7M2_9FLAO|nr:serine hydrolase domain-containing protein [Aquimarina algicola]TPN83898.1 beta-lactamase family protein [Aquimarina algicola]
MKKIYITLIVCTLLILSYFLFQPIFDYTTGWMNLPKETNQLAIKHPDARSKKADDTLKEIYKDLKSPAVSIAVSSNEGIIWSNAIGYQDVQHKIAATTDTKFRIGSSSKAVTSLGIGVLLENQNLNLDATVNDFVPYASQNLKSIKLKELASHTSGIRNYKTCFCFPIWEYYNNDEYANVEESVAIFNGDDLLFTPGSSFSYSSYNYTLLSAMIEGASKTSFEHFMTENVFKPLKIKDILFEKESISSPTISTFYEVEGVKTKASFKINNSNKWSGGGLIATPSSLVTLGKALLNHELFSEQTTTSLLKPVPLTNGEINKQNYAIGWRNDTVVDKLGANTQTQILHHGGTALGATSLLILFPEHQLSISILMNRSGSSSALFDHAYKIAKLFIEN